jgi:hypothetical protein
LFSWGKSSAIGNYRCDIALEIVATSPNISTEPLLQKPQDATEVRSPLLFLTHQILGVAELKYDSGLLCRGQDTRSPLSMMNLPVSFFPSAIQFMPKISNAKF